MKRNLRCVLVIRGKISWTMCLPSLKPCASLGEVDFSGFIVHLDTVCETKWPAPLPVGGEQRS
jgi:hypothetical protein